MKRLLWISVVIGLSTVAGVVVAGLLLRRPESTPAIRGRQLAQQLGCFACHGPEGVGGIADPTAPGGEVPDWQYATAKLFVQSEQDIRDWILLGAPSREAQRKAIDDYDPIVPMPAYREYLTQSQLDDLVAYFLAVSGWRPEIPDDAFEGRKIATRLGCFGCHGPSGMGGVANPGSFKGHIPPWDGQEFAELVRNDDELRQWILWGRIDRLWNNPAARLFLQRQKTPMPAYHDHLSDAELDKLVAYIRWLRDESKDESDGSGGAATVIGTITGVK
jgi:mono/diheme cytochrome c family protein